jgi:hypothetical protein
MRPRPCFKQIMHDIHRPLLTYSLRQNKLIRSSHSFRTTTTRVCRKTSSSTDQISTSSRYNKQLAWKTKQKHQESGTNREARAQNYGPGLTLPPSEKPLALLPSSSSLPGYPPKQPPSNKVERALSCWIIVCARAKRVQSSQTPGVTIVETTQNGKTVDAHIWSVDLGPAVARLTGIGRYALEHCGRGTRQRGIYMMTQPPPGEARCTC